MNCMEWQLKGMLWTSIFPCVLCLKHTFFMSVANAPIVCLLSELMFFNSFNPFIFRLYPIRLFFLFCHLCLHWDFTSLAMFTSFCVLIVSTLNLIWNSLQDWCWVEVYTHTHTHIQLLSFLLHTAITLKNRHGKTKKTLAEFPLLV